MVTRLLVGTDTSASADLAVKAAADAARAHQADLLVLYVRPSSTVREAVDPRVAPDASRYLAGIPRRFPGVRVRTRTEAGDPAGVICRVAEEEGSDVIVVGNRGLRGRSRRSRSSVPGRVLQCAGRSVLVVDTAVAH